MKLDLFQPTNSETSLTTGHHPTDLLLWQFSLRSNPRLVHDIVEEALREAPEAFQAPELRSNPESYRMGRSSTRLNDGWVPNYPMW